MFGMAVCLAAGAAAVVPSLPELATYAATADYDIYQDSTTKDLVFQYIEKSQPKFGYELLGFTLHRSIDGQESRSEYVTLRFSDEEEKFEEGGNTIIRRRIRYNAITDALRAHPDWYAEWTSGKPGKMWANGIITTYTYDATGTKAEHGFLDSDGTYHMKLYDFGSGKTSDDGETAGTMEDLLHDFSWSGLGMSDIFALFHKQFFYNVTSPMPAQGDIAKKVETTGSERPQMYTWHTSEDYNVGEAIPSGKPLTNGYLASRLFGTYSYEKITPQPRTYTVDFVVTGREEQIILARDPQTGNYIDIPYYKEWTKTVSETVTRRASYFAIRNIDIYELTKAIVHNRAYDVAEYPVTAPSLADTSEVLINGVADQAFLSVYPTDPDKHIIWPAAPTEAILLEENEEMTELSEAEIREKYDLKAMAEKAIGEVESWNDRLVINGQVFMDDSHVKGANTDLLAIPPTDFDPDAFGFVSDSKEVGIPISKENGKYSTTLNAEYVRILPNDHNLQQAEVSNLKSIIADDMIVMITDPDDRPAANMAKNEPIVVHTPIVAPVSFKTSFIKGKLDLKNNSPTQRILAAGETPWNEELEADGIRNYDLVLDHTYTLTFDPYEWLSESVRSDMENAESENDSVKTSTKDGVTGHKVKGLEAEDDFDEYIKKREVRFPFSAAVKNAANGDMKYYEPDASGYTPYIEIESNEVEFYLPPWAVESYRKFAANPDDHYEVEFKVTAVNEDSEHGINQGAAGEIENENVNSHVATFKVPVSITGQVYDFTIVGTNDSDMYTGYDTESVTNKDVAFADIKEEKKAGTKNKDGEDSLRTVKDDLLKESSDEDVLPLRQGSSHKYEQMGAPWRGTTFAFRVNTMGSFGSNANDQLVIRPSFRFVDGDGAEISDVKVYYTAGGAAGEKKFIEFGSARDERTNTVQLSSPQFNGSYRQADVDFTAQQRGVNSRSILGKKTASYSLSAITLGRDQMLYSGNTADMSLNNKKDPNSPDYKSIFLRNDFPADTEADADAAAARAERALHLAGQTWYGQYTIPEKLYICSKEIAINGVVVKLDAETDEDGYDAAADINNDGKITLEDLALTGQLSESSGIWNVYDPDVDNNGVPDENETLSGSDAAEAKRQKIRRDRKIRDGYLIVNFDITAVYNGAPVLSYEKGSLDMWKQQGALDKTNVIRQTTAENSDITGQTEITLQSGDVAIYDLRYGLSDKKQARLFMVN